MYFEGFVFHRDLKELLEEKLDGYVRMSVIKGGGGKRRNEGEDENGEMKY